MVQLLLPVERLERAASRPARPGSSLCASPQQIRAPTGERRVCAHPEWTYRSPAGPPRRPPAPRPWSRKRGPFVDAARHLDDERPLLAAPALSPAVRAGRRDLLARPPAARARGWRSPSDPRIDWRTRRTSPAAAAVAARDRGGPGSGAAPVAGGAGLRQPHDHLVLDPEHRLRELEGQRRPRRPRPSADRCGRPRPAPAAPPPAAEERVEEVAETPAAEPGEGVTGRPAPPPRGAGAADAGEPEHVVLAAPLGIAEGLVGQVDLLERSSAAASPGLASGCSSRARRR